MSLLVRCPSVLLALAVSLALANSTHAQSLQGFTATAPAAATGEEMNTQPDFWVLEVQFKPMRLISVELTDRATGRKRQELVWYLVYKIINRPLVRQVDQTETTPVNTVDPPPGPPLFVPELTLVTDDNGKQQTYRDVILPEAEKAILKLERRRPEDPEIKNAVEIVGAVPDETPEDALKEDSLYGLAMWRGVDPETDFFTVYMSGFSNGYKYARGPVSYDKLKELADSGELTPADALWDGVNHLTSASEACVATGVVAAANPRHFEWKSAGGVGGLFDEKDPPPGALSAQWFYSITKDRFGPDGPPPLWRKTIMQHYHRPGDRFDQKQSEFRRCGEPIWIYRPDSPTVLAVAPPPQNDDSPDAADDPAPPPAVQPAPPAQGNTPAAPDDPSPSPTQ